MPDKFQDTFPIEVIFVAGEQPTATKLSAWAGQTNAGLSKVEKALGDLKSSGFPLFSSAPNQTPTGTWAYQKGGSVIGGAPVETHLQILQLARLIGPASALNPRILGTSERGGGNATLTNEILPPATNFFLQHIPVAGTVDFTAASNCITLVGSWTDVKVPGDYWLLASNGRVVCQTPGNGVSDVVTYGVNPTLTNQLDTYHGANSNVIPHPNQQPKCTVTVVGSGYQITFPGVGDQQADWDETDTHLEGPVSGSSPDNINYGGQHTLPDWLTSKYSITDELVAEGLLGLWDGHDSRFISCTFHVPGGGGGPWPGNKNEVRVQGCTLDHTANNRYSIVVAGGTDITRTLDTLRTRYRHHTHSGQDGDQRISHGILGGKYWGSVHTADSDDVGDQPYSFVTHGDGSTSPEVEWTAPPGWDGSDVSDQLQFVRSPKPFVRHHPQLLGRWGQDSSHTRNAMLGHLLMSTNHLISGIGTAPPHFNSTKNSFGIQFSSEHGPIIYFCNGTGNTIANDHLRIRGRNVYIDESLRVHGRLLVDEPAGAAGHPGLPTADEINIINGYTHIAKHAGISGRGRLYTNYFGHETDAASTGDRVERSTQMLPGSNFQVVGTASTINAANTPFDKEDHGGVFLVGGGQPSGKKVARLEIDTWSSHDLSSHSTLLVGANPLNPQQARSIYTNTTISAKARFKGGTNTNKHSGHDSWMTDILGYHVSGGGYGSLPLALNGSGPELQEESHNIESVSRIWVATDSGYYPNPVDYADSYGVPGPNTEGTDSSQTLWVHPPGCYKISFMAPVDINATIYISCEQDSAGSGANYNSPTRGPYFAYVAWRTVDYIIIHTIPGGRGDWSETEQWFWDPPYVNVTVIGAVGST